MYEYIYIYIYIIPEKNRPLGNWLPSVRGQKRRKVAKNDVKLRNSTQNQRLNSPDERYV